MKGHRMVLSPSKWPRRTRIASYVFITLALATCTLIFVAIPRGSKISALAQSAVKYYYAPNSAIDKNELPLHIMVDRIHFVVKQSQTYSHRSPCIVS